MNDKTHIYIPLEHFYLKENNKFDYEERRVITSGITKTFKKRYINAAKYSIDLDTYRGLLIKYNPNKIMNIPIGSQVMEYKQLNESLEYMNNVLYESGLEVDIKKHGILTRYDNSYDLKTKEAYKSYLPLVQTLAPIKSIRQGKTRLIENTWYSGNKKDIVTIYDKTRESGLDFNCIRFEARHKLRDKNRIPVKQISEKTYLHLRNQDKQFIKDNIFVRNPQVLESEYLPFISDLMNTDLDMKNIQKAVFIVVVKNECNKHQLSLDTLFRVARYEDKEYNRNRRIVREMNKSLLLLNSELRDLYYELSYKFSEVA